VGVGHLAEQLLINVPVVLCELRTFRKSLGYAVKD
jgi:hypothetical protein